MVSGGTVATGEGVSVYSRALRPENRPPRPPPPTRKKQTNQKGVEKGGATTTLPPVVIGHWSKTQKKYTLGVDRVDKI